MHSKIQSQLVKFGAPSKMPLPADRMKSCCQPAGISRTVPLTPAPKRPSPALAMPCSHSIKLNMLQCSSNLQHATTKVLARGKHVLSLSGEHLRIWTEKTVPDILCHYVRLSAQFHAAVSAKPTMQNPTFSWPLASSRVKTPSWMEALKWQSHSWHCRSPAGHPPGGLMHSCPKCLSNSISISLRTRKRQALGSLSPGDRRCNDCVPKILFQS